MKKITFMLFLMTSLTWHAKAQSVINITTSGGSFATEKWVNITTDPNGGGTQVWGQGNGTYGNTPGLINQNITLTAGTYYVNCYDKYADGWDGTLISVSAYSVILTDNGGVSPDDGTDTDATSAFGDTQAQELEASLMIVVPEPACSTPAVAFTVVTECPSGTGFSVTVDVTDIGTASGITIADDQASAPLTGVLAGTYSFGPYVNGTSVVITVANDDNAICTVTSSALNFTGICPPANDACSGANVVNTLPYNFSQTDGVGSTNNGGFISSCSATDAGGMNDGLWFTFTATTDGTVDIAVTNVAGWDPQLDLYSGSCGALTCVANIDDGVSSGDETITSQAVTANTQYFINVGYYSETGNNPEGNFDIQVTGTFTLSVNDFENANAFTYFPNPVKNELTLKAQSNIQNVSIYNMLGQEVLKTAPNTLESNVNMNQLQSGAYFVKVTINDATETVRVVKQ